MTNNLIEFLKKYSTISNKFIDDFYGLYDMKDPNGFNVDLDRLCVWLNCVKKNIKETLFKSYNKNIDYKIIKQVTKNLVTKTKSKSKKKSKTNGNSKPKNPVGKPLEKIMLTPDTVKLLCMRSRAKKAEQVRNYYLQLEKIVDKFKNHIIEAMNQKIKKLENNQKPKVNPKKGVIYIIKTLDGVGLYKLGRAQNFKNRMNNYNSDKADDIVPVFVYEVDDIGAVERCVKGLLKKYQYRKYKEIYQADVDLIKEAIDGCDKLEGRLTMIERNKINKTLKNHKGEFNYYIGLYSE